MAAAGKAVVLPSGKRGLLPGGKTAVFDAAGECAACCVVAEPCVDCAGYEQQDDAVLSAEGTCSGICSPEVWNTVAPCVEFIDGFPGEGCCFWRWMEGTVTLLLVHDKGSGHWYSWGFQQVYGAFLGFDVIPCNESYYFVKDITGLIHCNPVTGKLQGAFTLEGDDVANPEQCEGCTLNVTIG